MILIGEETQDPQIPSVTAPPQPLSHPQIQPPDLQLHREAALLTYIQAGAAATAFRDSVGQQLLSSDSSFLLLQISVSFWCFAQAKSHAE